MNLFCIKLAKFNEKNCQIHNMYYVICMANKELQLMKIQLEMMKRNPQMTMNAISTGSFCAGFGGDLNGIKVPETFISGRLPPGVTPQQMYNQIVAFMEQTIKQAEASQLLESENK